jgi:hypothetical protein
MSNGLPNNIRESQQVGNGFSKLGRYFSSKLVQLLQVSRSTQGKEKHVTKNYYRVGYKVCAYVYHC